MPQQTQPKAVPTQSRRQSSSSDTINLLELADYLWKRILIIALCTLAGGIIAFGYTMLFVTPLYSSSVMIYVNNNSISLGNTAVSISGSDLTASRSLVETYIVILNSRETLEEIIDESGVSYTYRQLGEMISASAVNDTEVFEVTVISEDPQEASDIANTVVKVLPARIKSIVDGSNAVRVDGAIPIMTPVSPNVTKNTAMGALIGLVLSCGIYVVLFLLDTEIHSESYLLKTYPSIPLLTVVPDVDAAGHSYGYGYGYGHVAAATQNKSKAVS